MCGILFTLEGAHHKCLNEAARAELEQKISKRGPDALSSSFLDLPLRDGTVRLSFTGSVLHLRGPTTQQPVSDGHGNILLWNGEVFGGLFVEEHENDTLVMLRSFAAAENRVQDVLEVLGLVRGPFAFVYWQATAGRLWFGRDFFGRRSLLWNKAEGSLALTSVAQGQDGHSADPQWEEVPANGVYSIDLNSAGSVIAAIESMQRHAWASPNDQAPNNGILNSPIKSIFNMTLPVEDLPEMAAGDGALRAAGHDHTVDEFLRLFGEAAKKPQGVRCFAVSGIDTGKPTAAIHNAVMRRVHPVPAEAPRIAILFSGGIDSMMMAALADKFVDKEQPIDLINVAFGNVHAATNAMLLENAPYTGSGSSKKEKARKGKKHGNAAELEKELRLYDVPDRLTGRAGVRELMDIAPHRTWNFVEVDVPLAELEKHKQAIAALTYPLATVMDLSIACAMWFAARGMGRLCAYFGDDARIGHEAKEGADAYSTPARVVLVGIGADEQLGGYGRHRTRYNVDGWRGLINEVKLDVDRISHRNLGRDDRIISDHGREARFPFLDEELVNFLSSLPVWRKADMRYPRGIGMGMLYRSEKLLLRRAARQLGLTASAVLAKRAIQFGSRVAKIENHKEKGSDRLDS